MHTEKIVRTFKRTALATLVPVLGISSVYAEDENADTVQVLPTITMTAKPLNHVGEVNAGAFGVKDIMEIPISIQSYDAQKIKDTSARTAMDVLTTDASVSGASYGNSFDNFRLRGFAIDNFNTLRRDGLSLAAHHDVALENVERIDALKGPSGFLYGFNSPGGTVNYILKRPTSESFTTVTLQGSSLQGRYIAVDDSGATDDDRFGYRLNAAYEKNGNFSHASDFERKFIGLATDIRLSDAALLQLNFDWSNKSVVSDPLLRADQSHRTNQLDPSSYVLPPKIDRRDLLTASWFRHETEGLNTDAKLQIDLNDDWKSITQANYSRVKRHGGFNDLYDIQPNGDIQYAAYAVSRGEVFDSYSIQSYLSGKLDTGQIKHDLFFGASYKRQSDRSPFWDIVESDETNQPSNFSVGNILHPVQPPYYDFGAKNPIEYYGSTTETSIFASDLVTLNEYFQLLLGGRYIWYSSKNLSATALPQHKDTFVPAASIMFRPTPEVLTYLSYSKGFERGENAPFDTNNAYEPTGTIESEQYELGLKADLNQKLNLGLAVFDINRDANFRNLANDYVKSGQYNHQGVEVELIGKPTSNFTTVANLAYLHTKLKKVSDLTTLGKRSEGTPEWKAYISANYKIPQLPDLSIDGALSYVSNRAVDAQNSGFIPSYTLVDAGLKYETDIHQTPVTFRLLGKNLFNKYYYSSAYSSGLAVGQPREILLSVQTKF